MASLLALILVTKSPLGSRIVCSYPPNPTPIPRTANYRSHHSSSSDDDSDDDDEDDSDEEGGSDKESPLDRYLGFSTDTLGNLLSPSRESCDQPFELVVDALAFISHPVWLGDDEAKSQQPSDTGEQAQQRGRTRRRNDRSAQEDDSVAAGLSTSSSKEATGLSSSFASSQQSNHAASRLISFNFICVIDTPPDSHLSSHLECYYRDISIPITATLKYLEKTERWIGKESEKLLRAREGYKEKGQSMADHLASVSAASPLAQAIAKLYTSLKSTSAANIMLFNLPVEVLLRGELSFEEEEDDSHDHQDSHSADLALGLPSPIHFPRSASQHRSNDSRSPSPSSRQYRPVPLFSRVGRRPAVRFFPWQTLLPLENPDELKRNVLGTDSLLWRFLDIWSPTLSFAEYETLLDEPIKEIVEHLVHWRKARVVDVVSLKNIYGIKAGFKTDSLKTLSPKFAAAFPFLPSLVQLLSMIPPNAPFAAVYTTPDSTTSTSASHRALYLSALVWLLLHEVVEKNCCYMRILISEEIKRGSRMSWTRTRMESGETGSAEDGSAGGTSDGAGLSAAGSTDRSPRRRRRTLSSNGQPDDSSKMAIVPSSPITTTAMPSPVLLKLDPPILSEEGLPLSPSLMSKSARSMQSEFLMRLPKNRRGSNLATTSQGGGTVAGGTTRTLSTFSSNSERPEEVDLLPSFILDPGRPSEVERRWLSEICRDKDPGIVEKFNKMVRMFNGAHHLDEMRHRASLSRKDIRIVLAAFDEHLVAFHHP